MRFSIRDLLWLTVVVALGVGWWIDRSRLEYRATLWEQRGRDLIGRFDAFGWKVEWQEDRVTGKLEWDPPKGDQRFRLPSESPLPGTSAPAPNPRKD